jgi:hypothetical protein
MLKSIISQNSITGNVVKYLSYREAWTRIKQAQEQGFYLEAVTLEESIITDRLISYLVGVGAIERANDQHKYQTFARLIEEWKLLQTYPICIRVKSIEFQDLQTSVDDWRKRRNKVVHGMVKSYPGMATDDILNFLEEAKQTAKAGEILARAVSSWIKKSKVTSSPDKSGASYPHR